MIINFQSIKYQINNEDLLDYSLQTNEQLCVAPWIRGPLNMWHFIFFFFFFFKCAENKLYCCVMNIRYMLR